MDIRRIKWRVLLYAVVGTLVTWTALIACKRNGLLNERQRGSLIIVCPPLLIGVFPALFFWHDRRRAP